MNVSAAEQEMEIITTLFNNMVRACHSKCISTAYIEPDLNKGEAVCIDRCVSKYLSVNLTIGSKLTQQHQQQQEQMAMNS